ncbi:FAD/NAD(P)-binding protein [Salinisphaera sp. Q1T1-3]|uniref:FAD/NAD(P)-binding protein n=1 Tax=Salinisphaera sp. Q1T1-3 TaxID=2321229 RepID=UPI000E7588A3|nr:FAD/NAD(P)-binding protein [Salinisphaera sp. Q1T1-3]RJS93551.1 hypothetical protein D3260_07670 [Salinisphaera sp. Q1T1-3]
MTDYDWLIIGGGPHGRFAARAIAHAAPDSRLAVIDPAPALAAWRRRAAACDMRYLRSSNAHHLGARADSLRRFSDAHGYDARHALGYYRRPSRALFEAHAEATLGRLPQITARALDVAPGDTDWQVATDDGARRRAARVVLATGPGRPYRPPGLDDAEHVFDPDFDLGEPGAATVVIGGGITGAQLALRAMRAGHRVCWLTRAPPRASDFDAEPCYAGPRCMTPFVATPTAERTALLAEARRPGTLPPDVHADITAALAAGSLTWRRGTAVARDDDAVLLADGRRLAAERVILATGFASAPTPDSVLARVVQRLALVDDGAGHLALDSMLQAAPGLHVIGRPASLVLGPMAGNIKGARTAGQRLARVATGAPAAA